MKRGHSILGIVFVSLLITDCTKKIVPTITSRDVQTINVGTTANDGTGDPLRTAFIKVNQNFAYLQAQMALKASLSSPTFTGTVTLPATTSIGNVSSTELSYLDNAASNIQAQLYDTLSLDDTGWLKSDTSALNGTGSKLATKNDLLNIQGTGGGGKFYILKGIIGTTSGIPENGDSLVTHTSFEGMHVTVFRDGVLQPLHTTNAGYSPSYKFNSTTGTITVKPVFSSGEELEVWSTNTIVWETLIPEGGGGGGSDLLDSLYAYYAFEEISGTNTYDSHNNYDGTTDALVNQTGKNGKAYQYLTQNETVIPYNSGMRFTADEMSISLWFWCSQLPSAAGRNYYIFTQKNTVDPIYEPIKIILRKESNYIQFSVTNTSGVQYDAVTATSAFTAGAWYHLVVVNEGNGVAPKIYLNGSNVTSTADTFTGNLYQHNSYTLIGNYEIDDTDCINGYIDELAIFNEALSSSEVTELYNLEAGKFYPFE